VHITVKGRSFHASQPWRADNPMFTVATILKRIHDYRPAVDTSHPLFQHYQSLLDLPEAVTDDNIDRLSDLVSSRNPAEGAAMKAMSRLTLVPTMIKGGIKSNSIAERVTIVCDIRSMPRQDGDAVQRELTSLLGDLPGVSWELIQTAVSNASPADHPFAARVRQATAKAIGRDDFLWIPGLTAGFTDSRFMRPMGTITYDFAPSHPDADASLYGAHNQNESQDIASLITQTRMFVALAWDTLQAA
jgi:acetylornithine deacetylase/succinyl-diaminopimelate desuccinylase-like protein